MADQPTEKPEVPAAVADAQEAPAGEPKIAEPAPVEKASGDDAKPAEETKPTETADKPAETSTEEPKEKPSSDGDTEMKDVTEATGTEKTTAEAPAPAAEEQPAPAPASAETPTTKAKARRKSSAGEIRTKALKRKSSKARLTHTDAKPGDHFLVKLKGFPAWPAIISDESMLPQALVESRPQTAQLPDGTWREPYADGGKRVNDRNFPVMYLHTNEFGWVLNTNLTELTPEKARESISDKMRADLKEAYILAAEEHSIEFYKDVLKQFLEDLEAARAAKAATPKKSKKAKAKAAEEDLEMPDADDSIVEKPKSSKKRKAEGEAGTPQRSDSVKKPKIKLNTSSTPKAPNGSATPKDESTTKPKTKAKKNKDGADKKSEAPKEPKLTPEERHARKEKEVLYLRHKLQRGLLTRDQQPQEGEMRGMSDYITLLENFNDLEVSIIRTTKINKVLKAILKLESIPREEEFHFKDRSQTLLDKWTKLMAGDNASAPAATTNGDAKSETKEAHTNGVKSEGATEETKPETSEAEAGETEAKPAEKTEEAKPEAAPVEDKEDKPAAEAAVPPAPVETTA